MFRQIVLSLIIKQTRRSWMRLRSSYRFGRYRSFSLQCRGFSVSLKGNSLLQRSIQTLDSIRRIIGALTFTVRNQLEWSSRNKSSEFEKLGPTFAIVRFFNLKILDLPRQVRSNIFLSFFFFFFLLWNLSSHYEYLNFNLEPLNLMFQFSFDNIELHWNYI